MRKTLILFLLTLIGGQLTSALCQSQQQRYIYLWDVTLSMKGYDQSTGDTLSDPNHPKYIYDDVVKFLIEDIKSIKTQSTKIIVCPFQDGGIKRQWEQHATKDGIASIVKSIQEYHDTIPTKTDIVSAIRYAKQNLIAKNTFNRLVILTDGTQSPKLGGENRLNQEIRDWTKYASYAVALYVTVGDGEPPSVFNEEPPISGIYDIPGDPPGQLQLVDLCPNDIRLSMNDMIGKNDTILEVYFMEPGNSLGNDIPMVDVVLIDTLGIIKETSFTNIPIQNKRIELPLKLIESAEVLHDKLAQETIFPIQLKITNKSELKSFVNFTSEKIALTIVNKQEPRLTIRQK